MNIILTRIRPSLVYRFSINNLVSRGMSSTDAFFSLSSPLRELLAGSAQQDRQQLGVSEKDREDIAQWVEKAAQAGFVKPDALQVCDDLWKFCLVYQQLAVARRAPRTAHIPRQQLFDSRGRCCLWSTATYIRTSHESFTDRKRGRCSRHNYKRRSTTHTQPSHATLTTSSLARLCANQPRHSPLPLTSSLSTFLTHLLSSARH